MELKDGYKRGPSINADASEKLPQHFHRPGMWRVQKTTEDTLFRPHRNADAAYCYRRISVVCWFSH